MKEARERKKRGERKKTEREKEVYEGNFEHYTTITKVVNSPCVENCFMA